MKLKTISITTVVNLNISSDSYQKRLFFYSHQRKESLFHKNPVYFSVKNTLNMQVRQLTEDLERSPAGCRGAPSAAMQVGLKTAVLEDEADSRSPSVMKRRFILSY